MDDQEHETMYAEACKLVARGVSVIPVGGGLSSRAKEPHHEVLKATGHTYINREGRVCSTWKALQTRLPTAHELKAWFLEHRARGLGFVTGQLSGWVVVDVDSEGLPLLAELGWTPHVLTPSGGAHFYLKHPGWYVASNASASKAALPPGFDVRGDGGYVLYPPSRSRKGQYRRTDQRQPLALEQIPECVKVTGVEYRLREALGLTRPAAPAQTGDQHRGQCHQLQGDERVPVWLMLERAEGYAARSRNQGAFMFGSWMNANGYSIEEAVGHVEEYAARAGAQRDAVQGRRGAAFGGERLQVCQEGAMGESAQSIVGRRLRQDGGLSATITEIFTCLLANEINVLRVKPHALKGVNADKIFNCLHVLKRNGHANRPPLGILEQVAGAS